MRVPATIYFALGFLLCASWFAEGGDAVRSSSSTDAGKAHWAYVRPVRPELPKVKNSRWLRNPIDDFILARLENEKARKPAPEA